MPYIRGYTSEPWSNSYSSYNSYRNSSLNSNLSSLSEIGGSFNITDYNTVSNGSYRKLLNAYYSKNSSVNNTYKTKNNNSAINVQNAASMGNSIKDVMKDSLWEKKNITETNAETGEKTVKQDYDREAIGKALQKFTEDYNKLVDTAANSDSTSVLRNGVWMTKNTSVNSKLLSEAGITVGTDNKLSFDQDKLDKANISAVKTLFKGYGSYASQLLNRSNAITTATNPSAYNQKGGYSRSALGISSFSVWM
jgi:hypothetical protein